VSNEKPVAGSRETLLPAHEHARGVPEVDGPVDLVIGGVLQEQPGPADRQNWK
jgi:hypothetical protein